MTKKAFKEAMKRGLGRCIIELENEVNIEKYRDIVLYSCLHNFSYDTQIEGTRAKYMYVLQSKFEDNYFESKIIEKFLKPKMDTRLFEHYAEFLYCFAADGSDKAENALYEKFDELLLYLSKRKKYIEYPPSGTNLNGYVFGFQH